MGAKQSSPSAPSPANGRTRAYSGSDLPSASSGRTTSTAEGVRYRAQGTSRASGAASSSGQPPGTRPTSAGGSSGPGSGARSGISIPNSGGVRSSPESGGSSPEEADQDRTRHGGARLVIGSLPAHLSPHLFGGIRCPVCSKNVSSEEMDLHLVLCLTKPRLTYNEDVLSKDVGECAICLEDLQQGDTIARLPCLCIYHKGCIDAWFEVNRSCPEHPSD
ncbi:E3 ubiquitin-protein ligase znrf2 [Cyprinodon tularosa]|nr:E3 ubiquitin-protein ligase znrf2 [Cyprinodon tularosa]